MFETLAERAARLESEIRQDNLRFFAGIGLILLVVARWGF